MEPLFDDRDQHVDRHRDPDLRLDRVLAGAEESLDTKMLLDPLEEQLDLPAQTIELRDRERGQGEVVGQEDEPLARFGIFECDSPQRRFEALARVKAGEHDRLVANQARVSVYGMRVPALRFEVGLGADDEEAAGVLESAQTLEVEIAPIHYVKTAP